MPRVYVNSTFRCGLKLCLNKKMFENPMNKKKTKHAVNYISYTIILL